MKLRTLDSFFVRRSQQSQERGEASIAAPGPGGATPAEQAAEPDESNQTAAAAADSSGHSSLRDGYWRRHLLPRSLAQQQLVGRLPPAALGYTRYLEASHLQQLTTLSTHSWGRPALSPHGLVTVAPEGREGGSFLQALQFDPSGGELLAAASNEGLLSVHSTPQLLQLFPRGPDGRLLCRPSAAPAAADPLLLLDCGMPRLHSVRWDPRQGAAVAVTSSSTRQLLLFDLEHTQGRSRETLTVPGRTESLGGVGSAAVGLTDLAFLGRTAACGGGGYVLAAGAMGGEVFLWDQRAKRAPQAYLLPTSRHHAPVRSLVAAAYGQAIIAGTQSGEVNIWDLRGGSSGALRLGSNGVYHHPVLSSLHLRLALTAVPGLASQTAIPAAAIQWLQGDPLDERRLGFHLGCGWSGVVDLPSQAITHLHAPPQLVGAGAGDADESLQLPEVGLARVMQQRQPCWGAGTQSSHLLVPSCHASSLSVLDMSPCSHAGCAVPRDDDLTSSFVVGSKRQRHEPEPTPAAETQLSQPAVSVAAHPSGDLIVAGGSGGRLAIVMSRYYPS
ncbi:hypothetical protein N2152v2_004875 [Parachlorella kessleri]